MYHAKIWDEDKWNIHSSGNYNSSKYGNIMNDEKKSDAKYNEQKYGQKEGDVSSDYMKKEEAKEKDEKKKDSLFDDAEEEKKTGNLKDEDIPFRAAKQVFTESQKEARNSERKNNLSTIEDAIKKAIEGEKSAIIMDS